MAVILDFHGPIHIILVIFDVQVTYRCFLPSFKSTGLSVQKNRKIDFQDDCHDGHLGFSIGMILATFHLQVTFMLPTKFHVNWPFGSRAMVPILDFRLEFYLFLIYKSP